MRLAVMTSSNVAVFPAGESLALSEFSYELFVWDETGVDTLSGYDIILIRTCWDYHLKYPSFRDWLDELAEHRLNVVNPVPSLIWNSHKSYLLDLQELGIPVVPTYIGSEVDKLKSDFPGENEFIVKPMISASAFNLRKENRDDLGKSELDRQCIFQPFIREIQENGEWSLVFFGHAFSHAVRKKPRPDDFRVQSDLGGSVEFNDPPENVLRLARLVVSKLPVRVFYCRIDVVQTTKGCLVMEVEAIEPELFITGPVAISNYRRFIRGLSKK